ncbi:MAG: L-rhamnose mutarotase [Bacteroidota bacterium]
MNLVAFKMKLKPAAKEEYKRRHALIWPEIRQMLADGGINDYHIYFDHETDILFAVHNDDQQGAIFKKDETLEKWWAYMADLMDVNPDNSPVAVPLEQVFQL